MIPLICFSIAMLALGSALTLAGMSLAARRPRIQWNSADLLPPVGCPLLILANGRSQRAERTRHVAERGQGMEYRLANGRLITGRFAWTYP